MDGRFLDRVVLAILSDQDVGFLKEILVAPVSRTSIVLGRIAGWFSLPLAAVFLVHL